MTWKRVLQFGVLVCLAAGGQSVRPYSPAPGVDGRRTYRFDNLGIEAQARIEADGEVRFASGFRTNTLGANRADAARQFLRLAGGRFNSSNYEVASVTELGTDAFVRFEQTILGIPVHESDVVVGVDSENRVFSVSSRLISDRSDGGQWHLTETDALKAAQLGESYRLRAEARIRKAWLADGSTARPVWVVLIPAEEPLGDWEIIVDGQDGAVLRRNNLIAGATGWAFTRNPIVDGAPSVVTLPARPGVTLTNQFARVSSRYFGTERQSAVPDGAGNFPYQPGHPYFSEVQLFVGINRVRDRFSALGYRALDRMVAGVVYYPEAITNGPYYSPFTNLPVGTIHFAPVAPSFLDLAWDEDVIFHEYAHAVVNTFVGANQGVWMQALNEAYADYFSGSFHNDPDVGAFAAAAYGAPTRFLRSLRNTATFPYSISQDPHTTGLIWGGALWDVRNTLGAARGDAIALMSLGYLNGGSTMFDAAAAAADAANRLYGTSGRDAVNSAMARRGLATAQAFQPFPLTPGAFSAPRTVGALIGSCNLDAATFTIDVPRGTTRFSVAVQSTPGLPVETFVRFGRPPEISNSNVVSDYRFAGAAASLDISHGSQPELQTGVPAITDPTGSSARYYVRIGNCNPFPSTFRISPTIASDFPQPKIKIASGETAIGSLPPGQLLNSRQFQVDVGSAHTQLSLNLSSSADLALYLRYGSAVQLGPSGRPIADGYIDSRGLSETLTITPLTAPALRPGTWFVAIVNNDTTRRAEYALRATLTTTPVQDRQFTDLAQGGSNSIQVGAGAGGFGRLAATQFRVQTSPSSTSLTISASADRNVNVTVFIRKGTPVAIETSRVTSDFAFGIAPSGRMTVDATSLPAYERGAAYYIAVANFGIEAATVTVSASGTGNPTIQRPAINTGGVVTVASGQQRLSPLGLVSIYGRNFTSSTSGVSWNGATLPTVLDGVSVTIDGRAAYILFAKNDFMNVVVPDSTSRGVDVNVTVTNSGGMSDAVRVRLETYTPEFKTWSNNYVEALHSDGTATTGPSYVAPVGMYPRSTPARPGESISLWALGFGPSNPARPAGIIAPNTPLAAASPGLTLTIGGRTVRVDYAGLGGVGLYQMNVTIPADLPDGDHEIVATIAGLSTQRGLRIPVRR